MLGGCFRSMGAGCASELGSVWVCHEFSAAFGLSPDRMVDRDRLTPPIFDHCLRGQCWLFFGMLVLVVRRRLHRCIIMQSAVLAEKNNGAGRLHRNLLDAYFGHDQILCSGANSLPHNTANEAATPTAPVSTHTSCGSYSNGEHTPHMLADD